MPIYITLEDVKPRLIGKVRFTTDPLDENKMLESVAEDLITYSESDVELDLSPRYSAPFQTDAGAAFSTLPLRPTRNLLREMCILKSVAMILKTDFGSGSAVEGDKYYIGVKESYKEIIEKLLKEKDDKTGSGFKYPPLPGLKLNYMNEAGDDGYAGSVLVTSQGIGGYPSKQVNDPSQTFFNYQVDE